jgi:hypothetical protein
MMKIYLLLFTFILFYGETFAREQTYLARSPRALLMGDAYTAIADDAYTLYYNPALLARHENFSFVPLNPQITVTNALSDTDRFTDLGDTPTAFADAAMDYPIHMGLNMAPGLKMGKFGITAILNYQTNLMLQNQITPMLDVDHRFDKGFIAGFAMPLSGSFSSKSGGEHFAIGASLKYLQREGIEGTFNLTSTSLMDALSAGEVSDVLGALGQVKGSGWGVDLGADWAKTSGSSTLMASLAILDPYTILHTESNPNDYEVQDQPMQVNLGVGWKLDFGPALDVTVSADLRNIHQQKVGSEYQRDFKFGIDVGTPVLRVLAGMNSGQYTYGIQTNLGIIDMFLGLYDVEIGERLGQQRSSRALIYFSLFDFTFDP